MTTDQKIKESESSGNSNRGERRRSPRFPFMAELDALDPKSNIRIQGRVSDLGMGGCYVDTISPFPTGTTLHIRMRKQDECFEAQAKVTHSTMYVGMGLIFVSAAPDQVVLFQKWLLELSTAVPTRPRSQVSPTPGSNNTSPKADASEVLSELLAVLTRKGALTEEESNTMLRKLRR